MKAHHSYLAAIGCWLAMSAPGLAQYAGYPYQPTMAQTPMNQTGPMNGGSTSNIPLGVPSTQMVPAPQGVPTGQQYSNPPIYSAPPGQPAGSHSPAQPYPAGGSYAPGATYSPAMPYQPSMQPGMQMQPGMSYPPSGYGAPQPTPAMTPPPPGNPWGGAGPQNFGPSSPTPHFNAPDPAMNPFGNRLFGQAGRLEGNCADGSCSNGTCGVDGSCGCDTCGPDCNCGPRWFGGLSGLIMTRDNANRRVLTTSTAADGANLMSTRDPAYDWRGGYEARLGRSFGCSSAIEASYFYLDPFETSTTVTSPIAPAIPANSLTTTCDFCDTTLGAFFTRDFFQNAAAQSFSRRDEIHNVELNWLESLSYGSGTPLSLTALAGARWVRFHEGTSYGSASFGTAFGDAGGTLSAFFDNGLTNNFIGGQIGARGQYYFGERLRFYATPKVGIGALTVDKHLQVKRGDGLVAIGPNGTPLDLQTYKNDVGMLGQIDVGFSFQVTPIVSTFVGYRAMGLAGVALFENNIPRDFGVIDEVREINTNGSLILHGGVAGLQLAY